MSDEARTAWLVTSGCYSDYSVHVVCPDEGTAREVAERYGWDCEEKPLVGAASSAPESITWSAHVDIDEHGRFARPDADWPNVVVMPPGVEAHYFGHGLTPSARVVVRARDRAATLKAAGEYAAEIGSEVAAGVSLEAAVSAFDERHNAES